MNLSNYFWYFKSALTPRFCDDVIKYALEKKDMMAITGGVGGGRDLQKQPLNKDEVRNLKYRRNSDVVWLNDPWIYNEIHPFVHQANKNAGWNFNWDYQNLVNLQNTNLINTMIGIVMVRVKVMTRLKLLFMEKLENCP